MLLIALREAFCLPVQVMYNKRAFLYLGILIIVGLIIYYVFYDIPALAMAGGLLALSAGLVFMAFAYLVLSMIGVNIPREIGEENE